MNDLISNDSSSFIILSSKLQFKIGRFHTNISQWNKAYERGSYFEPSITRPLVADSLIIPIDYAGVDLRVDGANYWVR